MSPSTSRFAFVLLAAFAALAVACTGSTSTDSSNDATGTPAVATATLTAADLPAAIDVTIDGLVIHADTARTPDERSLGLSGRESLPDDGGMLFFLEIERLPGFTMRGMLFPLDFIWISSDLRVADLTENVPHPALAGEVLSGIQPGVPVLYVLEVDAGVIEESGIEVGDAVTFSDPGGSQ